MKKFLNILKTVYKTIKIIIVKVVKAISVFLVSMFKHKDFPLVMVTWVLVGITFWGVWNTSKTNKSQLAEMRRATELQYRPYLFIKHDYKEPFQFNEIFHPLEKDDETDSLRKIDFFDTEVDYTNIEGYSYEMTRKIRYINYGSMPLRLNRVMISTIRKNEWEEDFHKSYVELVRYIRDLPQLTEPETDVTVPAKDSFLTKTYKGYERTMGKYDFDNCLFNKSQIILYPYTYVEYEDFFGKQQYNTILIQHIIIPFIDTLGKRTPSDIWTIGEERYRWDVLLDEQRAREDSLEQATK